MKRIVIALILALMLMMTVGTSVALATGSPDTILIDPNSNPDQIVLIIEDDVKDGPPDILVKTPHGPRPPDDCPPPNPGR